MALEQIGGTESKSGISRLSTEYLYWVIKSSDDFSNDTVSVAFVEGTDTVPQEDDWNVAEVVTNPDNAEEDAIRLLIGPATGGVDLTPPDQSSVTYRVWIKIETTGESIVRLIGTLTVR